METFSPLVASAVTSPDRPSLFELLAQEQLRQLFQPAVRYVLHAAAQHYPRYLIPVVQRHEEFYLALMLLVERHHLVKHGASFSEYFYGLRRRRAPVMKTPRRDAFLQEQGIFPEGGSRSRMRSPELYKSMIQLVLVPYLRLKLRELFISLGGTADTSILGDDETSEEQETVGEGSMRRHALLRRRLRRVFLFLYPWLNTGWEAASLAWHMAYLFERTNHWNIGSRLVGVFIGRMVREDLPPPPPPSANTSRSLLSRLPSPPALLPFVLLTLKFLEFYHSPTSPFTLFSTTSSSTSAGGSSRAHPPLPPPPRAAPTEKGRAILADRSWGECPLCREPWKGPTVAGAGGWVYCWLCIWNEVGESREGGKDPVSGLRLKREDLRRVLI